MLSRILFGIQIVFLAVVFSMQPVRAQESLKKVELTGYVSDMQTTMFADIDSAWMTENMIHNRLNFKWYISNAFTFSVEMRNRFIYGEFIKDIPGYADLIDQETGWLDLSGKLISGNSFLLHSAIDRAWIDFTKGNWQIRLGRQRINWGQNYAWNPNDIFNTYSFFEFDYPERPGSDALRIQYYTGFSSLLEAAVKVNSRDEVTAAAKWRFNKWGYDFQVLGGVLDDRDLVSGLGWAGNIGSAGFRGEFTYLHPAENIRDTSGILIASVGLDYTFPNSLGFQTEVLYNGARIPVGGFEQYYYMPLSVKTISFTDWSILLGGSYPITPLLQGTFNLMYFPSLDGYFAGPSLSYSLSDNLVASFAFQHFSGEFEGSPGPGASTSSRQVLTLAYIRFKYSF